MVVDSFQASAVADAVKLALGPEISVVLPVHNEEGALRGLISDIEAALQDWTFEVIAVDDGSTDDSASCLEELREGRPWLRVFRHELNRGQTAALETGIGLAFGPVLALLDSDGQNDPADIPRLLGLLTADVDIVAGRRRGRHESAGRRAASGAANWLLRRASGLPVHDTGCTLKVFRAETVKGLHLLRGDHRFMAALARTEPRRVAETWVADRPRIAGRSHYGFGRVPIVAADLAGLVIRRMVADRPLHSAAALGGGLIAVWGMAAALLALSGHAAAAVVSLLAGFSLAAVALVLATAVEDALRG